MLLHLDYQPQHGSEKKLIFHPNNPHLQQFENTIIANNSNPTMGYSDSKHKYCCISVFIN